MIVRHKFYGIEFPVNVIVHVEDYIIGIGVSVNGIMRFWQLDEFDIVERGA